MKRFISEGHICEMHKSFLFAHGALELYLGTYVFTPKGYLLVAQKEFFETSFSNPSKARHDIT
jgi:hypothetical protein